MLERQAEILKAILAGVARQSPCKSHFRIDINDQRHVWFTANHRGVQLIDLAAQIPAGGPLIDTGAVGKTVTDDDFTRRESRGDGALKVIAPGSGEQ